MRRRDFIKLLGGAAAWPLTARARSTPRKSHASDSCGMVPPLLPSTEFEALRAGLRQFGYIEGKNIVIEFRWAETVDQLPELVADLVSMNADVIFAMSSTEVEPTRQATKTIPIVFALLGCRSMVAAQRVSAMSTKFDCGGAADLLRGRCG